MTMRSSLPWECLVLAIHVQGCILNLSPSYVKPDSPSRTAICADASSRAGCRDRAPDCRGCALATRRGRSCEHLDQRRGETSWRRASHRLPAFPGRAIAPLGVQRTPLDAAPAADARDVDDIEEPGERLRVALTELYAYYAENEQMTANLLRDATVSPSVAEATALMREGLSAMTALLSAGWSMEPGASDRVRAGIGHAVSFETWRSLCRRQELEASEAIELMLGMMRSVA